MNWIPFINVKVFHITGLGAVDYEMVDSSVRKTLSKARGTYKVYSSKDRFPIGKSASIYGFKDLSAYKWKHGLWI